MTAGPYVYLTERVLGECWGRVEMLCESLDPQLNTSITDGQAQSSSSEKDCCELAFCSSTSRKMSYAEKMPKFPLKLI